MNSQNTLSNLRHSASHLLAAAVLVHYPNVKLTIGPAIDTGFYYDFDFGLDTISEHDLPTIQKTMHEIVKQWKAFEKREITEQEAYEIFQTNAYKKELITEHAGKGEPITLYTAGNFTDLCQGGHCQNPAKDLKHFALLSIAGAYWRGNEKNKMLTRIYGTAFPTKDELDTYLHSLEIAKSRDHKKLGKDLGLFTFSETVGKGLPLWTPKGTTLRRILERFVVDEEIKRGYLHVMTPDIANLALYKKSGHYPYYKDSMYAPIAIDDEEYMLRPMTCPHHFELYLSQPRSYRELPMRIAELAQLYRYEQSGELMGLLRVRTFCLADAHIVARPNQAMKEINDVLDLIDYICGVLGIRQGIDYRYRLSLGDRNDETKYYKDDNSWEFAENILRQVLISRKAPYYEAEKEAAFYGPKIDVQMKNVHQKEDTAFTVQYDFVMPKRFKLTYINESGKEEEPIVIHRSSIGAIERSVAFLIEHYGGAFPLWLSPVQVGIVPIAERHIEQAKAYEKSLKNAGFRVEVDERSEPMGAKIRDFTLQKVPYIGIIGDKEVENASLSVRTRRGENLKPLTVDDFITQLTNEVEHKS